MLSSASNAYLWLIVEVGNRGANKVGQWQRTYRPEVHQQFKDIAWKAQLRLHGRYRKLVARGKKSNVTIMAVSRELVGFVWDIERRVPIPTS